MIKNILLLVLIVSSQSLCCQSIIPENNYDLVINNIVKKEKDVSQIKKWITESINDAYDPVHPQNIYTKKFNAYLTDMLDWMWVGMILNEKGEYEEIDDEEIENKWGRDYNLEMSFGRPFGSSHEEQKISISKLEYLGELNGDWFRLKIRCTEWDRSTLIGDAVRLIKVIRKNNFLYIDNMMSTPIDFEYLDNKKNEKKWEALGILSTDLWTINYTFGPKQIKLEANGVLISEGQESNKNDYWQVKGDKIWFYFYWEDELNFTFSGKIISPELIKGGCTTSDGRGYEWSAVPAD